MTQHKRSSKREKRTTKSKVETTQNYGFHGGMIDIVPLTDTQDIVFQKFDNDTHMVMHGLAGTGKTFLSLYLSLRQVLSGASEFNKIMIVRSVVPTREMGFLPGTVKEKIKIYEAPYEAICSVLFGRGDAYNTLKTKNLIEFISSSFIQGLTIDNSIVIVDEIQNMTFSELDSIITRIGKNTKLILCGDYRQSFLQKDSDKKGLLDILKIIKRMDLFEYIEFGEEDIVRSAFVKQYIIEKSRLGFG